MTDIQFRFRKGAGSNLDVLFGTVTLKPTLAHSRGTSMVLPAPSTWDIINGEVLATNVQPTPEPVEGVLEWGYEVTVKDRHGKSYSFLVGVPDSTTAVEFVSLPRYFETKPPLFGQGPKGDAGEAATISVGTVTAGTEASVTNSGTTSDAKLDFVLPKGDKGDRGDGVPAGGTALQYIRKDSSGAETEWATLDKTVVGLSNVDNTADVDKPVSILQQEAIDSHSTSIPINTKGITDKPSTYPEGLSVTRANQTFGWPNDTPSGESSTLDNIVTLKRGTGGTIQLATDYYRNNTPIWVRKSGDSEEWSEFERLATIEGQSERGMVSFLDFGGVADGNTDNSAPLREFLDYLNSEKRVGFIPNGDYRLMSQVVFPSEGSDFGLQGESVGGTRFLFRPGGTPSVSTVFTGVAPTRMVLSNFTLDAGYSVHGVAGGGMSFRNTETCLFENLRILDHGNGALMCFADNDLAGQFGRTTVINCESDGYNNANNGFLFVNLTDSYFINVRARNGGRNPSNSPSSGIQLKNKCTNCHIINSTAIGWKDGFGMGGDTQGFGPENNTIIGAYAYDCHHSFNTGSAVNNRVEIFSTRASTNDIRLGSDSINNFVTVDIDNNPKTGSSIHHGSRFNTVVVKYLPQGVTNLATLVAGASYNKVLVESRYASSGQNISTLINNLSEATNNFVGSLDSSFRNNTLTPGGVASYYFYDPEGQQNYIAHQASNRLFSFRSGGSNIFTVEPSVMGPGTDNSQSLGTSTRRFTQLYAVNGAINTSDEREKTDISSELSPELRAWAKIDFVKFKWKEAVDKKGNKARWHFGVIAQDVKKAFESEGLDPFEYGILCYDSWEYIPEEREPDELDSDGSMIRRGELIHPEQRSGDRYGIRYEEALALEAAYLRSQLTK